MELYGLIGEKLGHSLSPQLHSHIYRSTGRKNAYYCPYEVAPDQVAGVPGAMGTLGITGLNVTIPYKQEILPYLDELAQEVRAIGAANTLHRQPDGAVVGHNTDAYGFVASLRHHGVEPRGKRFVMCGMSGAGRSIRYGLEQAGAAEVTVASTDPAKGITYGELAQRPGADVIVNCTPLGMSPDVESCIVEEGVLAKYETAVDIVYNPLETTFLRRAKGLGLTAVSGLYMLVFQGMRSFEIWTGEELPAALADDIYRELRGYL